MITFPDIDPVALQLGPIAVHWYGLSYIAGIALGWWYLRLRARRQPARWDADMVGDLVFYAALGAVLGGRLGYILFYSFDTYRADPLTVFAVWRGGMSFHGGVIGFVLALLLFARTRRRGFMETADFVVPAVPIGLGLGRLANFVNQELWGAATTLPWGVVFTHPAAGPFPRHPSQLYEAVLEGLVLFLLLAGVARLRPPPGTLAGLFLAGYAVFRFLVEFVREPDAHIGYLYGGWLTMGQVLSLPMFAAGLGLLLWSRRHDSVPDAGA